MVVATIDEDWREIARAVSESTQLVIERRLLLRLATNLNILLTIWFPIRTPRERAGIVCWELFSGFGISLGW